MHRGEHHPGPTGGQDRGCHLLHEALRSKPGAMTAGTGLTDAPAAAFQTMITLARTHAIGRLCRRGGLTPFAICDHETVLDGDGHSNRDQLDDLYRRLGALPPGPMVVVSEGSSDSHKNLLILYAESPDGSAWRVIEAISFTKKPLFFGPILLRQGQVNLQPVETIALAARIHPRSPGGQSTRELQNNDKGA